MLRCPPALYSRATDEQGAEDHKGQDRTVLFFAQGKQHAAEDAGKNSQSERSDVQRPEGQDGVVHGE